MFVRLNRVCYRYFYSRGVARTLPILTCALGRSAESHSISAVLTDTRFLTGVHDNCIYKSVMALECQLRITPFGRFIIDLRPELWRPVYGHDRCLLAHSRSSVVQLCVCGAHAWRHLKESSVDLSD